MKYNWWLWQSELSDEVIDDIVKKCEKYPVQDGLIDPKLGVSEYDENVRRSEIRWIYDEPEITKIFQDYGHHANDYAFGFDIILNNFDIQYTTYHGLNKGCYSFHTDNQYMKDGYYDRKVSVVIQLNDPSEYEGGKFEFEINGEIVSPEGFEKKGSIITFPSFMKHRVTNVTKGTRNSLVSWIQGPHFR